MERILIAGQANYDQCDNKVKSARYTIVTFFPKAILEQFRRFANLYFLGVGFIMFLGTYTKLFDSAISPWTTLGPLAFVISISLLVEGYSDYKRHLNDVETNTSPCVVLTRSDEYMNSPETNKKLVRDMTIGKGLDVVVNVNKAYYDANASSVRGLRQRSNTDPNDPAAEMVHIAFQKVPRQAIRQGQFVLVRNREMIPADILLLASSNDQGGAYIETSSIDGETNLKLRNSPHLPKKILQALRAHNVVQAHGNNGNMTNGNADDGEAEPEFESLEGAIKRLTRFSALGRPDGISALELHSQMENEHPHLRPVVEGDGDDDDDDDEVDDADHDNNVSRSTDKDEALQLALNASQSSVSNFIKDVSARGRLKAKKKQMGHDNHRYIAALTTEPPNASVNTFSGKLTLPPFGTDATSGCHDIPLGPENLLLRGAVIRNTEWALGVAVFTGNDTKLVQNAFDTPSKFSQLDRLMNKTVIAILILMALIFSYLAGMAVHSNTRKFDDLYYIGYNRDTEEKWPYFPSDIDPPNWNSDTQNWLQYFLLFITLLSNFIPLSLYVTVELVQACLLVLIHIDLEMYDDTTDTRAVARSTIVSDLGRVQYIFSDKTGTLTQNVMRFKRCSVDGSAFGAPIQRSRPKESDDEPEEQLSSFHPLRQLLVGKMNRPGGLENIAETSVNLDDLRSRPSNKLTFHAEMFLRVMSLCHTVVVEKDIDKKKEISAGVSTGSQTSVVSFPRNFFKSNRKRADTGGSGVGSIATGDADFDLASPYMDSTRARTDTAYSFGPGEDSSNMKNSDGAPMGFAYQAESPDEGALVSAASLTYGFQVVGRDVHGIRLRCPVSSHFQDRDVVDRLKSNKLSLDQLAADTAISLNDTNATSVSDSNHSGDVTSTTDGAVREETWTILAINKFDSDRKRMSILLRSPEELGGLPILFCKGADSSMLDPTVCSGSDVFSNVANPTDDSDNRDDGNFVLAHLLGIQVHLGEFAKEGLRTLVLGMRILSEDECTEWLKVYKEASVSLKNRKELLTAAAITIETGLHIVGATAIEDKLQVRVPETIATLEKAGIKLWVLTGDKRETAVEIGYSTNVLTSKMHLIEVPDTGIKQVRTQMAMEFIRLVKSGKLSQYQRVVLNNSGAMTRKQRNKHRMANIQYLLGKCWRMYGRLIMRVKITIFRLLGMKTRAEWKSDCLRELEIEEASIMRDIERRRIVRDKAEETIKSWINEFGGGKVNIPAMMADEEKAEDTIDELGLTSQELPAVFNRATSARSLLNNIQASGSLSQLELRQVSIAYLTAQQSGEGDTGDARIVDEDTLSLESFVPSAGVGGGSDFDRKKRTLLERAFAVDKEVRKGHLKKHLVTSASKAIAEGNISIEPQAKHAPLRGKRGLVIEGDALKHLLGDPQFEEILFAVASSCESVIACRVSPRQKALLVNLVRHNINPEPITLAIGDGANDVGMIQEAHVGIGISGKEGKQAVNASDFSIAQFRFLETLLLIHGRWNFFRLSAVVLFSFYKNAVMAGTIILYCGNTVYSGTPLYDQWVLSMLNFVAAFPIIFVGLFDRCLSKSYVRQHPEVYRATRENELITVRSLGRWIGMCLIHMIVLYYCTVPQQSSPGAGITTAFVGLMKRSDRDRPGDGEAGDLLTVGTVTFSCLIVLLALKVLFESRSLVHGKWPAFTCRKDVGEGFLSRLAYTWIGVTYGSILFYFFGIGVYQLLGKSGASGFSPFLLVVNHAFGTRSMNWLLMFFIPIVGMVFDVCLKVFANMYFPTQTQIHVEIEAKEKRIAKQKARQLRKGGQANNVPSESDELIA